MGFYIPTQTGAADMLSGILMSGMQTLTLSDNLRVYAPIVHDVIDVSDKRKMRYNRTYVEDETQFDLRESFEIEGGTEQKLNRGRMDSLVIRTGDFESLTGITVHPFHTEPFKKDFGHCLSGTD
jgi:hypothetical protein